MAARVALGVALILASASTACAQVDDVALVASGPGRASATSAFESFVPIPLANRFDVAPAEPPESIRLLVTIDTGANLVRVWRRHDGIVLERRFDVGTDDGYAIALVASELLEVARAGGDPASVGATVVALPEAVADVAQEALAEAPAGPESVGEAAAEPRAPTPSHLVASFAVGLGVEAWFSMGGGPWIVQPTLFLELLAGSSGEAWRVGGALFASALGGYGRDEDRVEGSYARHDFGARLSVGGDLGPIRTHLLGHARVGASAVVGAAQREGVDDDRREATRLGWFVGLGLDLRQPLVLGLELFVDVSGDLLPAPVRFTAFGETLTAESSFRLTGRIGIAWRVR